MQNNEIDRSGREEGAVVGLGSFREAFNALEGLASHRYFSEKFHSMDADDYFFHTNGASEEEDMAGQGIHSYEAWRVANSKEVSDVPDTKPGSIGSLGPPTHASAERLKGGYRGIVRDARSLQDAVGEFISGIHQLDGRTHSRVQYRMIAEASFLRRNALELRGDIVEAVVPLDPGHLGEEPVFVYLAHNDQTRGQNPIDSQRLRQNLQAALSERPEQLVTLLQPKNSEYAVHILNDEERASEEILDQVAALYARFGWNRKDVRTMLTDSVNVFGVARQDNRIVSCGIAELAQVPIGSTIFRIAEMTEAATLLGHERQGFYTAISTNIMLELRRRSQANDVFGGELDLVFGEGNGLSQGVLTVGRHQGRTFSTETRTQYGFPQSGVLRQQVHIDGPINSHTRYNDLVVMSLTRSGLYGLR